MATTRKWTSKDANELGYGTRPVRESVFQETLTNATTSNIKTGIADVQAVFISCDTVAAGTPHTQLTAKVNTSDSSVVDLTAVGANGTTTVTVLAKGYGNAQL